MSPRRNAISLGAPAGTNYLDPVSKVLSFVVRGTSGPVRIRQLEVVSVGFGIAVSFSDFFENNQVDPNSVDEAFKDQIPPNYAANYDPVSDKASSLLYSTHPKPANSQTRRTMAR